MEGYPIGNFPTPTPSWPGSVIYVLELETKAGRMRQRERTPWNAEERENC